MLSDLTFALVHSPPMMGCGVLALTEQSVLVHPTPSSLLSSLPLHPFSPLPSVQAQCWEFGQELLKSSLKPPHPSKIQTNLSFICMHNKMQPMSCC